MIIDPCNDRTLLVLSWNDSWYRSEDGGHTWTVHLSDQFRGQRYTRHLAVEAMGDNWWRLYAGTGTSSIWQRQLESVPVAVPIESLSASNDGPTLLGSVTTFTATVGAGSNVDYSRQLGDGADAFGKK